ncbi:MAG: hypothetical protein AMXMBFR84_08050 [Candidatus Hydrogenedentota bacterium]
MRYATFLALCFAAVSTLSLDTQPLQDRIPVRNRDGFKKAMVDTLNARDFDSLDQLAADIESGAFPFRLDTLQRTMDVYYGALGICGLNEAETAARLWPPWDR